MEILLDGSGRWYKGNLHMHTTLSDGRLTPEEAAKLYEEAGYDFIALTDHFIQSRCRQTGGLLLLPGCEYDTGSLGGHPIHHIVGVGMEKQVDLSRDSARPPQSIIDAVVNAGGLAILAHPAWSMADVGHCMSFKGLCGVEIYNTFSGTPWNCRPDSSLYIDLWSSRGMLLPCMAADDCHFYGGEEARSFTMVKAIDQVAGLSAAGIKAALTDAHRCSNVYASQGPLFRSIMRDHDVIEVECTQVEMVVFYTDSVYCADRVTTAEGGVTNASYRVKPTDSYVRVELVDSFGRKAWSSPFGLC